MIDCMNALNSGSTSVAPIESALVVETDDGMFPESDVAVLEPKVSLEET